MKSPRFVLSAVIAAALVAAFMSVGASAEVVRREVWAPEEPLPPFLFEYAFGAERRIGVTPRPSIGLGNFDQVGSYESQIASNVRGFRQFRTHQPEPRQFDFSRLRRWRAGDDFLLFFGLDINIKNGRMGDGKYNYLDALEWLGDTGPLSTHPLFGPFRRGQVISLFKEVYGNAAFQALEKGQGTLNLNGLFGIDPYDSFVLLRELRTNIDRFLDFGGTAAQIAASFALIEALGEVDYDDDVFPPGAGFSFSGVPAGQVGGGGAMIIPEPASLALLALGGLLAARRRR